jgi:prolyl-tRNA synthetase
VTARAHDYSQWYADVIAGGDLVDSSPVKGCLILKPRGFAIWERIQGELDARIRAAGAVNAYFPLLLPLSHLSREAQHVEGFAKECAVVTHHRLRAVPPDARKPGAGPGVQLEPDPDAALPEPLVIRPTSETIIWSSLARWVHSHRDLPVLLNQWANVVRWEMRTRPFLRTSEFLWQEGHTAHATEAEARAYARRILHDVYRDVCEGVLAMPVVPGVKTPSERFAGADDTLCLEAMMQNGWALQAATSHFLGQNFARAFDVQFETAAGTREHVWATSWGASTRLVGGLIMSHSDDTGLVLPPRVAPVQVVVLPIVFKSAGADARAQVLATASALADQLAAAGVRVKLDAADVDMPPGARFFEWERRVSVSHVRIGRGARYAL